MPRLLSFKRFWHSPRRKEESPGRYGFTVIWSDPCTRAEGRKRFPVNIPLRIYAPVFVRYALYHKRHFCSRIVNVCYSKRSSQDYSFLTHIVQNVLNGEGDYVWNVIVRDATNH